MYHILYWIPFVQKLTRVHMGNMDLMFLHIKFGNITNAYLSLLESESAVNITLILMFILMDYCLR